MEIKQMLNQVDELTESDRIFELIRKGESKTLEFKSSFRHNLRSNNFEEKMIFIIMKTINAMMNTIGGTLLIGVQDDGEIIGIEHDKYENIDKYKLSLYQSIENYMDKTIASKMSTSFIEIGQETVCQITIPKINKTWMRYREQIVNGQTVYGKGKLIEKLFIRTGPSSNELMPSEVDVYFSK